MTLLRSVISLLALQLAHAAPQAQSQTGTAAACPSTITSTTARSASSSASSSPSSSPSALPGSLTTEETDELFTLHESLVNIPSISDDEIEAAEWLEEYLSEKGYYVERVPVTAGAEGRFNVFAFPQSIRDEGAWPEVLISSHIDTVRRLGL